MGICEYDRDVVILTATVVEELHELRCFTSRRDEGECEVIETQFLLNETLMGSNVVASVGVRVPTFSVGVHERLFEVFDGEVECDGHDVSFVCGVVDKTTIYC
jgi:hypothetical protein